MADLETQRRSLVSNVSCLDNDIPNACSNLMLFFFFLGSLFYLKMSNHLLKCQQTGTSKVRREERAKYAGNPVTIKKHAQLKLGNGLRTISYF